MEEDVTAEELEVKLPEDHIIDVMLATKILLESSILRLKKALGD